MIAKRSAQNYCYRLVARKRTYRFLIFWVRKLSPNLGSPFVPDMCSQVRRVQVRGEVLTDFRQGSCGVLFLCARFSCASALFARAIALSCGRFRMRLCTAVRVQCQAVRSCLHACLHRRRCVMPSFCARLHICVDIVARKFIIAFFAGIFFSLIVLF